MGDSTSRNLFGTGNISGGNVENSHTNTLNIYTRASPSDKKREVLEWLSSLGSLGVQQDKRHADVRHTRIGGIGDWLLETNEFSKWRDCEDEPVDPIIFCCGGPGVGKTYLRWGVN